MPIRTSLMLISLLLLSGCASWFGTPYQDPEVHLVKVETVKARLLQQEFVLHFRIDNPNDSRLLVRALRYKVRLNELTLAEGESDQWVNVAAHSHKTFKVPIRTNLWEHLKDIVKLLKHPDRPIHYRLDGDLSSGFFWPRSLHLSRSGEIIPGDFIPE